MMRNNERENHKADLVYCGNCSSTEEITVNTKCQLHECSINVSKQYKYNIRENYSANRNINDCCFRILSLLGVKNPSQTESKAVIQRDTHSVSLRTCQAYVRKWTWTWTWMCNTTAVIPWSRNEFYLPVKKKRIFQNVLQDHICIYISYGQTHYVWHIIVKLGYSRCLRPCFIC